MQQSGFRQSGFIRNAMGSITVMSSARQSVPSNDSELQLFRVLERANLLLYYESFIQNGGDDVQQLYDAYRQSTQQPQPNEENNMTEFIEIMKMVGMTKPLHVRRLQNVLIQWSLNPAEFQRPLIQREIPPNPQQMINLSLPQLSLPQFNNPLNNNLPNTNSQSILHKLDVHNIVPPTSSSIPTSNSSLITHSASLPSLNSHSNSLPQLPINSTINSSSSIIPTTITSKIGQTINSLISPIQVNTNPLRNKSPSSSIVRPPINTLCKSPTTSIKNDSYNIAGSNNLIQPIPLSVNLNALNTTGQNNLANTNLNLINTCIPQSNNNHQNDDIVESNSPICMTIVLKPEEISRLQEKAFKVIELYDKNLYDKKIICDKKTNNRKIHKKQKAKNFRNLEHVLNMSEDNPHRIAEIRKYASIYGRFDSKRHPSKLLSLHEVYVNEAAIQLCLIRINLILNRKTLFQLSRETVKQAGYNYSKGHSRSQFTLNDLNSESNSIPDNETDSIDIEREDSNDNLSISSDTSSSISKNELDLNNKKQSNYFTSIMNDQTLNLMNSNQVNNGTKSNNNLSKDAKFMKDQLENLDKLIELNEIKIEDQTKNTINESTEIKTKLIELKEDQSLLIEQRNNLFKQICTLDNKIRNSPKETLNSDTEEDLNSQTSNCSQNSCKEISQILENNLINSNSNQIDQHNGTIKRKQLNSTTPRKTKLLKFNQLIDDKSDEIIIKKKDETNGIDLRITHHFNHLNK